MKQITARFWLNYIKINTRANKTASRMMEHYLAAHGTGDMDRLALFAYGLVTRYGEASAALSCDVYESVARAQGVDIPDAEPAEPASFDEVAKAVRGTAKMSPRMIPDTVGRLVKQAGADTTLKNALRDGAYFAWVPQGDTCPFCCILAGNGWKKASKETIQGEHAEHIHANCDCEFAVSFDGPGKVEGYDPDRYREMYDSAEGDTPREKLNSMRRQQYAANKDRINAQKRAAYAKRNADSIYKKGETPDTKRQEMKFNFYEKDGKISFHGDDVTKVSNKENDIYKQSDKSIEKGIRNLQKKIDEHKDKILNPEKYVPNWEELSEIQKQGLIKHWKKEIDNFEKSIRNRRDELERRRINYE